MKKINSLIGFRCMGCGREIRNAPCPHCGAS